MQLTCFATLQNCTSVLNQGIELSISKESIIIPETLQHLFVHKIGEKVYSRPLSGEKRLQVAKTVQN